MQIAKCSQVVREASKERLRENADKAPQKENTGSSGPVSSRQRDRQKIKESIMRLNSFYKFCFNKMSILLDYINIHHNLESICNL